MLLLCRLDAPDASGRGVQPPRRSSAPASLVHLTLGAYVLYETDPRCTLDGADFPPYDPHEQPEYAVLALPPKEMGTGRVFGLNLRHLTALTHLNMMPDNLQYHWEVLRVGDELPTSLIELHAPVLHGDALEAVQGLTRLTYLNLVHDNTETEHLMKLASLSSLKASVIRGAGSLAASFFVPDRLVWWESISQSTQGLFELSQCVATNTETQHTNSVTLPNRGSCTSLKACGSCTSLKA